MRMLSKKLKALTRKMQEKKHNNQETSKNGSSNTNKVDPKLDERMGEKKKSAALASNSKNPIELSRSMATMESQAKSQGGAVGMARNRSNSVPDVSAIVDFFPSSHGHHHHPKKFQVAPDGAAAKYATSEKDAASNEGIQPQGGELMKRVSPLDVDTAPQRAADEKGKKESFGLAAYKYLIPLLLWAVVQLFSPSSSSRTYFL
uniref:Uncharacterized protein n=1 Tax=Palpitomonas bilix TaxID=652834 RepID=A0A7S3GIT9_9EUKA|mmetsp:Transcript_5545/g.12780  ORF Transcript_5545/g.12780 Transcript_5545/m.12780 type:complete len:203 (+) Transcript_5545:92-700(+)